MLDVRDSLERQYLSELLKYSLIIVSSVPLLVAYPFLQKHFIKGIMVGSLKG
jgi:multiple sugar transport system permease protein/putative aldouronate transport system permease protein